MWWGTVPRAWPWASRNSTPGKPKVWHGAEPVFFKANLSRPCPASSPSPTKDRLRSAARQVTLTAAPPDGVVEAAVFDVVAVLALEAVTVVVRTDCRLIPVAAW